MKDKQQKIKYNVVRSYRKFKPIRYNDKLLDELTPISEELVNKLKNIYNLYWKNNWLICPKYEDRPIIVKTLSVLNGDTVYSISKLFVTKEYSRTGSPILKNYMESLDKFNNDLAKFEKNRKDKIRHLLKYDICSKTFLFKGDLDNEEDYAIYIQ